ncbi:MAG: alpha/beta hydrolase [Planctomycetaceae bacterium]|nr:alpha/beta hydrolase [Planctomycetaceae bacterium]
MTTELNLILLPGLDGSGVLFRPLLPHLPAEWQPVVVSYPPDEALSYEDLLPLVLSRLPTDAPFAILGESFSGPLAIMAAATRPPNLRRVILSASFIRSPLWFRLKGLHRLIYPQLLVGFPLLARAKTLLSRHSTPEVRQLLREALAEVQPEVLAERLRSVLLVDVSKQLVECPVPILYLRGDEDFVVPHHNAAEIQALAPSMQIAKIPAPHLVMQTQPALAAAAMAEFLMAAT